VERCRRTENIRKGQWSPGSQETIAVKSLTGSVSLIGYLDDVQSALAAADMLVAFLPENSNSVLEAMAAGLPVVNTKVKGTEPCWQSRRHLLHEPGDIRAFLNSAPLIRTVLWQRDDMLRMGNGFKTLLHRGYKGQTRPSHTSCFLKEESGSGIVEYPQAKNRYGNPKQIFLPE
jgi:hypothetical protein